MIATRSNAIQGKLLIGLGIAAIVTLSILTFGGAGVVAAVAGVAAQIGLAGGVTALASVVSAAFTGAVSATAAAIGLSGIGTTASAAIATAAVGAAAFLSAAASMSLLAGLASNPKLFFDKMIKQPMMTTIHAVVNYNENRKSTKKQNESINKHKQDQTAKKNAEIEMQEIKRAVPFADAIAEDRTPAVSNHSTSSIHTTLSNGDTQKAQENLKSTKSAPPLPQSPPPLHSPNQKTPPPLPKSPVPKNPPNLTKNNENTDTPSEDRPNRPSR